MRTRTPLVAVLTGLLLAPAVFAATPRDTRTSGLTTPVRVTMTEFKFALSRRTVPRGTVAFRAINKGETAHDFKIKGKKTPIYDPGRSGTLRVTFTKRGRYPYLCTIPGHAASGMKGVLTVK